MYRHISLTWNSHGQRHLRGTRHSIDILEPTQRHCYRGNIDTSHTSQPVSYFYLTQAATESETNKQHSCRCPHAVMLPTAHGVVRPPSPVTANRNFEAGPSAANPVLPPAVCHLYTASRPMVEWGKLAAAADPLPPETFMLAWCHRTV